MNSQLYKEAKHYPIPRGILMKVNAKLATSPESDGKRRAKNLVKMGYCTYPMLKRMKNFFDYLDPKKQALQFELVGGNEMKNFVEQTLQSERERTNISNQNKVMSAPPSPVDSSLNINQTPRMGVSENDLPEDKKSRGALAVIVNEEGKALIVKRAPFEGSWMPNKHALVGGGIEEGEEPINAARREAMEETGLTLEHFIDEFIILSPPNTVDHVFIAKAPENPQVTLNNEHTEHGWYGLDEIDQLDAVPMLKDCVELALNKMQEKSIYSK
jgi:8-oxo-dGTP pyrophosphatase MutT (NUDIX family)